MAKDCKKIRPLHDRIVVKRIEENDARTHGGLYIPETAKEKPQIGEVIAVGSGKLLDSGTRIAIDIKKGDRILFGKYAGTEIKIEGDELLMMREEDVLGVLEA